MAEETKVETETTEEIATQEETVDYDKELAEAAEKQKNQEFAARRIAKKAEQSDHESEESDDLADRVAAKILPALKQTAESSALEVFLDRKANGNESLKKLLRFNYENRTNPNLDIATRVEDAYAIANKKVVEKTVKEINVARTNRSQISNIGQGQSQETHKVPGQNVLSDAQINDLKAKHKDWKLPGSVDDFIANTIKRLAQ